MIEKDHQIPNTWTDYKISEFKYGNTKLLGNKKHNQIKLVLAVSISAYLYQYGIECWYVLIALSKPDTISKEDNSWCILFKQAFNDKVVIARCLVQYWQIFSSFLIFSCYFTRLKAREISCKRWKTREIFPILNSAPYYNNHVSFSDLQKEDNSFCFKGRYFYINYSKQVITLLSW